MDFKSVKKRLVGSKRGKSASSKVRIERTVGVVLVVLMGAAAMMLAARRTETVVDPAMTSKIVAPVEEASIARAPASHVGARTSAPKNASGNAVATAPVTIVGCLEQDDDVFKLKNTEGNDAPQSRSWKSGFLKKKPATIVVLDAAHRWKLEKHVGERVSITGPLADRELQVRTFSRLATSCS